MPRIIVGSRMDRDRADYEPHDGIAGRRFRTHKLFLSNCPSARRKNLNGVVDLVRMKAYTYEMGGNGKGKEGPIPGQPRRSSQRRHTKQLVELVAEGNDELMEEFFDKGTIPEEHLVSRTARRDPRRQHLPGALHLRPRQYGHRPMLDFIADYTPTPVERGPVKARRHAGQRRAPPSASDAESEPLSLMSSRPSPTRSPDTSPSSRFSPAC